IPEYEDFLCKWQKMTKDERQAYRDSGLEIRQQIEDGIETEYFLDVNDFYTEKVENNYIEQPVSILGHIKASPSFICDSLDSTEGKRNSNKNKNSVYYIKIQVTYNGELFYLLSNEASAVKGVLGWMKASNISAHRHVAVDLDPKTFIITGNGRAFTMPWGGRKNCVYDDLDAYHNEIFHVDKTDLVGNNVWYRGMLDGELVWVHQNQVTESR